MPFPALGACNILRSEIYNRQFSLADLNHVLNRSVNTAPGHDDVNFWFLSNCGVRGRLLMLQIFNQSWRTGKVPSSWKFGIIRPVLKLHKCASDPGSYRLILLLCNVSKILERLIFNRLYWLCEKYSFLSEDQFGFRKGRSTTDALLCLTSSINFAQCEDKVTIAAFLDVRKVFESVSHDGLCQKLVDLGFRGNMLYWISDFVRYRDYVVSINGNLSKQVMFAAGVPQGSIIAPLLFSMYTDTCASTVLNKVKYADDLVV